MTGGGAPRHCRADPPRLTRFALPAAASPARILLHPGFHHSGNAAVETLLWEQRDLLAPHLQVILPRHLDPVLHLARGYARKGNPLILADMVGALERVFTQHPPAPGRDMVISAAGLSGLPPGQGPVKDYGHAGVLCAFLTGWLAERWPSAELSVVYTTRSRDTWLREQWLHTAHGDSGGFPAFRRRFATLDLDATVAEIAGALAPVAIYALPLDDAMQHPAGPGGALLELAALPAALRDRLAEAHGMAGG